MLPYLGVAAKIQLMCLRSFYTPSEAPPEPSALYALVHFIARVRRPDRRPSHGDKRPAEMGGGAP